MKAKQRRDAVHWVKLPAAAEGSALLQCNNRRVIEACGFDFAFWAVCDEGRFERCLRLLGHSRAAKLGSGWSVVDVAVERAARCTDDTESLAVHDGVVYALGSCFGKKNGPLDKKRSFFARYREAGASTRGGVPQVAVEIAREPFRLHRLINDGLRDANVDVMPLGPHAWRAYIERTLARAAAKRAKWSSQVCVDDWPINIEGMAILDARRVVLGLRYPVAADGSPLLVVLDGMPGFFHEPGAARSVVGVVVLSGLGSRGRPRGVRGIEWADNDLHLLTGPIGGREKGGALELDHPGSLEAGTVHSQLPAAWLGGDVSPGAQGRVFVAETRQLCRFEPDQAVEGLARMPDGRWAYVADERGRMMLGIGRSPKNSDERSTASTVWQ